MSLLDCLRRAKERICKLRQKAMLSVPGGQVGKPYVGKRKTQPATIRPVFAVVPKLIPLVNTVLTICKKKKELILAETGAGRKIFCFPLHFFAVTSYASSNSFVGGKVLSFVLLRQDTNQQSELTPKPIRLRLKKHLPYWFLNDGLLADVFGFCAGHYSFIFEFFSDAKYFS